MRGGLTELRKTAVLDDTWGMQMMTHLFSVLNVHVMASIPNGIWAEHMGLLDDLWIDPPAIANGMITAPEQAGHGLAFKAERAPHLIGRFSRSTGPPRAAERGEGTTVCDGLKTWCS